VAIARRQLALPKSLEIYHEIRFAGTQLVRRVTLRGLEGLQIFAVAVAADGTDEPPALHETL